MEHVLDGALAHAAAVFGLAAVVGSAVWSAATGEVRRGRARLGAALLGGAVVLQLVAIVAVVEGPVMAAVTTVLTRTAFGASLGVFAGCAAVAVGSARAGLTLAAAAGAAGALARMGHAGADGGWSVLVTAAHVLAAVVWIGGLGMAVGAEGAALRRFGRVAVGCVVVLSLTGGLRAAQLVGAGRGRLGEEAAVVWMLALGMKLVAVAVALGFAWRVRRAVREGRPAARIEGELAAAGVVVLVAALMGGVGTP